MPSNASRSQAVSGGLAPVESGRNRPPGPAPAPAGRGGRPRPASARPPAESPAPEAGGGVDLSGGSSRGSRRGGSTAAPSVSGAGSRGARGRGKAHGRYGADGASTATGARSGAGAGGSLSGSRGQVNVRSMIAQLNRDRSPAKRQREDTGSERSTASSAEDEPADEEQEQLAPILKLLQRELQKQTVRLTDHFERAHQSLKEELQHMQQRIGELEHHVSGQGDIIMQLHDVVESRDGRIRELEDEMEDLRRASNVPFLVIDGPGVPAPPREEPWREDVAATTKGVLSKYMPATDIKDNDIVQCYRSDRGKKLMCQFSRCGPGSVRDAVYDNRMSLRKDENGRVRSSSDQLFVSEKLTPGALEAYRRLRIAKRDGHIDSVHTKYGYIYVRMFRHGARQRVSNRIECERVLRGKS